MAKRTDIGVGRGTATLDPNNPPELPATTSGSSTLGAGATSASAGIGVNRPSSNQQNQTQHKGTGQQIKEQAKSLAGEAKEQTVKAAGQARDQVQEMVGRQKDEAAERLDSLAGALRETARRLEEDGRNSEFGRYADQAARQVDRLSGYLRDHDLRDLVREAESFARRRPELVLGGTFLAGLMLARFLKSSAPERSGLYSAGYQASAPVGVEPW